MRRCDHRVLAFIAICAYGGCAPTTPSSQLAPRQYVVRAPFDSVWSGAVAYFRENRLPLDTMDRAKGRLTTAAITLSAADSARWIDCGKPRGLSGRVVNAELLAVFRVNVEDLRDSVDLGAMVTADWIYTYTTPNLPNNPRLESIVCASNGAFETGLVQRVSPRASP